MALLQVSQTSDSVINYLACLRTNIVPLLLPDNLDENALHVFQRKLAANLHVSDSACKVVGTEQHTIDSKLALLMTTSGSTGAGKCVALSAKNLCANAKSILAYLPANSTDTTLLSMPLSYSYGLSVLNTHLTIGASIVLSDLSPFDRQFWTLLADRSIASISGVPQWYRMLLRMRFTQQHLPALRYITQAGGKLSEAEVETLAKYAHATDKQFFVMYGQTEATARMAFLSPDKVLAKPGAVGQPVPGGEFKLARSGEAQEQAGELCYRGDNVMLGYVDNCTELAHFAPPEWLNTGDIASIDRDGDVTIVGRLKRFIKVAGERVNLDALETVLIDNGHDVRCAGKDDRLIVAVLKHSKPGQLTALIPIPARNVQYVELEHWPMLSNGKVDYQLINRLAENK
ncbi:AMP-binding protein [Alteromonas sp. ASW11-19]|uniref:AMP-binding protein n=1 Tax=Alteromonas salexigens TaxID=2982530 RepID=A0ABT2VQ42_9ALTE|nr:AMP-binding protein [Alteromonas salexigens]MCU7554993.1 AMP-binding protein [Alteromonas salexigens]